MSTVGTISRRTPLTGVNNPAYQVSKTVANDSLVVASAAANGSVMVRDSANPDGWGFLAQLPAASVDLSAGVGVAQGGTGLLSYAVGDLLYASGATALSKRAAVAVGAVLVSGGVGAAPVWSASPLLTGALTIDKGLATNSAQSLLLKLNEAGAGDYMIGVYSAANPFGARRNQVMKWGYNFNAATNAKLVAGEHALIYDIESYFTPDASNTAAEAHLVYISPDGTKTIRLMSQFIDRATSLATTDFSSDRLSFTKASSTVERVVLTDEVLLSNSTPIRNSTNNFSWLRQRNAAGTQNPSLMMLTSQDCLLLGDGNVAGVIVPGLMIFGPSLFSGYVGLKGAGAAVLAVRNGNDSNDASISALTFQTKTALVALGGGSTPTLGTIGGSGPTVAAQNTWMKMLDSTGATCWVPVWK